MPDVLRLAAFTDDPAGGNPAGVVLDASSLPDAEMQRIAADVGYSETAFLVDPDPAHLRVRYFSPVAEVPFCGHATIATAVALGEGRHALATNAGEVVVRVEDGTATLTSVTPAVEDVTADVVADVLGALGWAEGRLDPALPPRVAFAGARHLVLGLAERATLAALDYDFDRLRERMSAEDWTTVALVHRRDATTFDARNAFAVGGVVEDPATGAAAAAFGAYLRALGLVDPPVEVMIHQGADMGRPSLLAVGIDADPRAGIRVSGTAVTLT